ncbi:hypothetical protein SAMN05192534_101474 [Alteribacillus persepolensis]|uniref:Uncharacterized protein n=1 Tax=Alteribacillus persepolensis TaxID=568899 RepID=A0A1G7ZB48_9BACI|nr:hypothetical protein [Alteribacillus persepolensis]SDH05817.1 hypothetical protein SAMN05192534_101474 [Alteribacillus persepolensis]
MTKAEMKQLLEQKDMQEALELLEEAENGELAELELVESLGLLRDATLNDELTRILKEEGVNIIYISDDDG